MRVKVVLAHKLNLENDINEALRDLVSKEIVDIKLTIIDQYKVCALIMFKEVV